MLNKFFFFTPTSKYELFPLNSFQTTLTQLYYQTNHMTSIHGVIVPHTVGDEHLQTYLDN